MAKASDKSTPPEAKPEWVYLPEAVEALPWLEPEMAQRLIGEALGDGKLLDRPISVVGMPSSLPRFAGAPSDAEILADMADHGEIAEVALLNTPFSTPPERWRLWIETRAVDWTMGEVWIDIRPRGTGRVRQVKYRPQLSRSALLACFPGPATVARPHRTPGTGLEKLDQPFVQKILRLVDQEHMSFHAAAEKVVGDGVAVPGGGGAPSKVRRLRDRAKKASETEDKRTLR